MRRRSFFSSVVALSAMPLVSPEVHAATKSAGLKVTGVEIWRVTGDRDQAAAYQKELGHGTIRNLRNPPTSHTYIKILTNAGVEGFYGPSESRATRVIQDRLARSLIGKDPLAIDSIWEDMTRGAHRYTGYDYLIGVSYLDNTLWDLRGKFFDVPVYKLLGGSRNVIDVYASAIQQSIEPDRIRESAAQLKEEGYKAQKWFPERSRQALGKKEYEEDVAMMRILRETVGDNYDIMIDPLLTWNLPYAIKWCKDVEQYHPRWLEEPFQTYLQLEPLARLREMTSIPIATGEHNYNRWVFHDLMKAGAVDILNPDPEWGGGISEIVRICAMASAWGLQVSPHHMKQHALAHIVASQPHSVCPYVEYRHGMYMGTSYFDKYPIVHNGNSQIELSDRPGFGVELDESKIVNMELIYSQS
ncbi:mandelate racemase/muconate lactonizing enzyme family protein [Candidatus Latescibacterota bacterium]